MTNSFWYLNRENMLTTWDCPVPLQKELVCSWDDIRYAAFRTATAAVLTQHDEGITRKCRCVFKSVIEYQRHIQNFHRWVKQITTSVSFGMLFILCRVNYATNDVSFVCIIVNLTFACFCVCMCVHVCVCPSLDGSVLLVNTRTGVPAFLCARYAAARRAKKGRMVQR